jgi:hypothetical protein
MVIQRLSYEEVMLERAMNLNYLMPHYWSELFLVCFQLFDPTSKEYEDLQKMITEVELMIYSPEELEQGTGSLFDIEMALESNPDFYSFFERPDGMIITKFDVERELNKIKQWVYARVREKAIGRKFTKFRM